MFKSRSISIVFCIATLVEGSSQSLVKPAISVYSYHPQSADKESWQRLNLWLSSIYFRVVKEGEVDLDSCLLYASRSLGLSRLPLLAEGIDDSELTAHSQWVDQRDPGNGIKILSQATGKKHLELLVLLGAYYAFQPQHYYRRDSAEYFLSRAINESKVMTEVNLGRQARCLLGKVYVQANDEKKGDAVFRLLTNECEVAGDQETKARAYVYWGTYPSFSPATTQGRIRYFQIAADIYQKLKNVEAEINCFTDLGYMMVLNGQLQNAYDAFLKAFQLVQAIQFPYIHYNTEALAMVTMAQGKFGEPFKYALQSVKVAESSRDSIGWAYFYSRLSDLYHLESARGKEDSEWRHKALDRFLVDRNPALYSTLNDIIVQTGHDARYQEALDLVNDISKKVPPVNLTDQYGYHFALATCYNGLRKFDLSAMHLAKADSLEAMLESFRGRLRRPNLDAEYGYFYLLQGEYDKAKSYYERSALYPTPARTLTQDLDTYRKLIYLDSALKDPVAELAHYNKYTLLLDSNFRISKIRQAEELQVLYQTQEKENQITLLDQQTRLEQANLKQASLLENLTIAGIVAVLIIAVLVYRQSRLRKKNNNVITHKNEQLQHLLTEKEWLLKEIHHRVKNNLQIVMSLLNSQSVYIDNDVALIAIQNSQHRVHAMSLIHQKLYNTENLSSIDMSFYIRELVSYLDDSFNTGQRIRFEYDIEALEIDVSQAVPLGLILNEAITNSIKYAFPNDRAGVISISLSNIDSHQCLLIISDNGIGMPLYSDNKKPGSLGMSLIQGLTEDLAGKFSIDNKNGTTIKISFVQDMNVKRSGIDAASFVSQ